MAGFCAGDPALTSRCVSNGVRPHLLVTAGRDRGALFRQRSTCFRRVTARPARGLHGTRFAIQQGMTTALELLYEYRHLMGKCRSSAGLDMDEIQAVDAIEALF